jgi:hypothetical protein
MLDVLSALFGGILGGWLYDRGRGAWSNRRMPYVYRKDGLTIRSTDKQFIESMREKYEKGDTHGD